MTKRFEIYKCDKCGNIIEVLHEGASDLHCCGQPMKLFTENTTDAAKEKHLPVIEKTADSVTVKVGSVDHPMEEKHYIEWVQLIVDGKSYRQFLNPGDKPMATFKVSGASVAAREYCNLHGLWKAN
jgi:superoxide reductase